MPKSRNPLSKIHRRIKAWDEAVRACIERSLSDESASSSDESASSVPPVMAAKRDREIDEVIHLLYSAIAEGIVYREAIEPLLLLEFRASEPIKWTIAKAQVAEAIKVAQKYETLNGEYKGFKQDKQKIKEGRERMEEAFKKFPMGSN